MTQTKPCVQVHGAGYGKEFCSNCQSSNGASGSNSSSLRGIPDVNLTRTSAMLNRTVGASVAFLDSQSLKRVCSFMAWRLQG